LVSLVVDEHALDGTYLRFSARQVHRASVEVQPPGVVRLTDLGLCVQAFPADGALPALGASCDTTAQGPLWQALQSAACAQLGDDAWRLVAAQAEPVRYKPASRCVLRYHLTLEHPHPRRDAPSMHRTLTLFGKLYADRQQACFLEAMMQQLYAEQMSLQTGTRAGQSVAAPFLPRPLGLVAALGLRFDEAVQPAGAQADQVLGGVQILRPQVLRGRAGGIMTVVIPREELRSTAIALARLHTSAVRPNEKPPRAGAQEATRARERQCALLRTTPRRHRWSCGLPGDSLHTWRGCTPTCTGPPMAGLSPANYSFKVSMSSWWTSTGSVWRMQRSTSATSWPIQTPPRGAGPWW
jgi:hypothetical protein